MRRRRRWLRTTLLAFVALLLALVIGARFYFSGPRLGDFLAKTLFDQIIGIKGRIEVETIDWAPQDIFRSSLPVEIKGVKIYGPQVGQGPLPRTQVCPSPAPKAKRVHACCDQFPGEATCRPIVLAVPRATARVDWVPAAWPFGQHDVTIHDLVVPSGWVVLEQETTTSDDDPMRISFITAFEPRAPKDPGEPPPTKEGLKGPIIRVTSGQLRDVHLVVDFMSFRGDIFGVATPWRVQGVDLLTADLRDPRTLLPGVDGRPVLLANLDGVTAQVAQILLKTPPSRLVVLRDIEMARAAIPETDDGSYPDTVDVIGEARTVDGGRIEANGELRRIFDDAEDGPQVDLNVLGEDIGLFVTYHSYGWVGRREATAKLKVRGPLIYPMVDVEAEGLDVLVDAGEQPIAIPRFVGLYDMKTSDLEVREGTEVTLFGGKASVTARGNVTTLDVVESDIVITDPLALGKLVPANIAAELGGTSLSGRVHLLGEPGVFLFDRVDMRLGESRIRARGRWQKVPLPDAPPDELDFTMGELRIEDLAISAPGATGRITGRLDPTKRKIALRFDAAVQQLAARLGRMGGPAVGESITLAGNVAGSLDAPVVTAKTTVRGLPATPTVTARLKWALASGNLDVSEFDADPLGGRAQGSLRLTLGKVTRIRAAEVDGVDLDLTRLDGPLGLPRGTLAGRGRFQLTGGGTLRAPTGEVTVDVDGFAVQGMPLGTLRARASADPQRGLTIRELTAGGPSIGQLSLHGGVSLADDPELSLRLELSRLRLAEVPILKATGLQIDGMASANLEVGGTVGKPTVAGRLSLVRFAILSAMLGTGQIDLTPEPGQPGRIRFAGQLFQGKFAVEGVLGVDDGDLDLTASLAFRRVDLDEFFPDVAERLGIHGWVSGRVAFRLKPTPYAELRLETAHIDFDRYDERGRPLPLAVENRGEIAIGVDLAKKRSTFLAPATLASPEGEFTVSGFAAATELGLKIDGTLQLAVLDYFTRRWLKRLGGDVDVDRVAGVVVMNGSITGTPEQPLLLGRLGFRDAMVHLRRQDAEIRIPSGAISVSNKAVEIADLRLMIEGQALNLGGRVELANFIPTRFDLALRGRLSAEILEVLAARVITAARGSAELEVTVTGTPQTPLVRGFLGFDETFAFRARGLRREVALTGGLVRFDNTRVTIEPAIIGTIDAAPFRVTGAVILGKDFAPSRGRLGFHAESLAYRDPGILDLELNTDLTLDLASERLRLGGNVEIVNGRYIQDYDAPAMVSGAFTPQRTQERIDPFWKGVPMLETMQLAAIEVSTVGPLQVNNNLARMTLNGKITVRGTPAFPDLDGQIRADEGGTFTIPFISRAGNFNVKTGSVVFSPQRQIPKETPDIRMVAETTFRDLDQVEHLITVEVDGTLGELRYRLSTNTGLTEPAQVLALMATGRTTNELRARARGEEGSSGGQTTDSFGGQSLGGSSGSGLVSTSDQIVKQFTGDLLSTVLEDQLKRAFRLDCFRLAPGTESVQLKVCKNFTRSVALTGGYEVGFRGGNRGSVSLDYKAVDNIFFGVQGVHLTPESETEVPRNAARLQVKFKFTIP